MDKDKEKFEEALGLGGDRQSGKLVPRARNKTVMLTPEITGEVRARLASELQSGGGPGRAADDSPLFAGRRPLEVGESASSPFGGLNEGHPQVSEHQGGRSIEAAVERVVWSQKTPVRGFLVSYDRDENGVVFELRVGRLIVSSEAGRSGNFLVVQDQTISPMHAILRISDTGEIQVLDQLSEFGTTIRRLGESEVVELSGDKGVLGHGDIVSFGNRKFCVCVVIPEEGALDL